MNIGTWNQEKVKFPWETIIVLGLFLSASKWAFTSSWLSSSDFHSCLEISGSMIAILGGIACLIYFFGIKQNYYLIVGLGFFVAGAEDLIHGIISFPRLFPNNTLDLSRFIPATYVSGRFALAGMILLAPLLEKQIKRIDSLRKEAMIYSAIAIFFGVGATFFLVVAPIPQLIFPGFPISRPLDFLTMIAFLGAFYVTQKRYREDGNIFSRMVLISVIFNVGGQFYMSFSKQLYDPFFDLAHVANILSYMPPLLGIAISGLQKMKISRLENIQRRQTQIQLRDTNAQLESFLNELWRTRSRSEMIIENIDEGIVVVDPNWMVMVSNKKAATIMGLESEIPIGSEFHEILDNCPDQENLIRSTIDNSSYQTLISINETEPRTVDFRSSQLLNEHSENLGRIFVFRDVTREKEIEHMKNRFVASVSHELRTPLTSIKGFTATILRDPEMTTETRNRFLGIVDEESTRLAKLIENLLEISHLDSASTEMEMTDFHLREVLLKVAVNFVPVAKSSKISLVTEIPHDLPMLFGDQDKLQAAFVNLVGNALKFTPEGGCVGLSASVKADGVSVQISDSGCGVPESEREKIFGRFYRVYRPGEEIQGTGLGLSLAKETIEASQGEILVEESPEGGALFTVNLPVSSKAGIGPNMETESH